MVSLLGRKPTEPVETAPQPTIGNNRPRMVIVIECLDNACGWANRAAKHLAAMTLDVEQYADKLGHYRDSLIKTVEDTGGDIKQAVEGQIADFLQEKYRSPQPTEGE